MKWMRERDLLIAQTMAFVQSVTGKMPEAVATGATSFALPAVASPPLDLPPLTLPSLTLPAVDTTESTPAESESFEFKSSEFESSESRPVVAPTPDIKVLPAAISALAGPANPAPVVRPDLRDDFQSEIKARVANFRAHQERFTREREAYCSATMARVHAALQESLPRPRPSE
jgi:hypothetical protein